MGSVPSATGTSTTGAGAGSLQDIKTRSQVKVIGISKYDLCLDILFQITMIYTFDRTYCSHRHENRSLNLAMICSYDTTAGRRIGIIMCLNEFHSKQFSRQRYELFIKIGYLCLITDNNTKNR